MARGGLTVQDIVLQIVPVRDQRIVEQLRYWTDEKLLIPLRGTGRGTGNYREYGEETVWRALLLCRLAWRGASLDEMKAVAELLDAMNTEERKLWELAKRSPDCEVYVTVPPAGIGTARIFKGLEQLQAHFKRMKQWPAVLVVNLGATFDWNRRLRPK